jgi:hypothetical protein
MYHFFVEHPRMLVYGSVGVGGVVILTTIAKYIWKLIVGLANASLRGDLD